MEANDARWLIDLAPGALYERRSNFASRYVSAVIDRWYRREQN
jgi:hypothetical protein